MNPELNVSSENWTFMQTEFQRFWDRLGWGLAQALLVTLEPGLGEAGWLERDATSWSEQSSVSEWEGCSWLTTTLQNQKDLINLTQHHELGSRAGVLKPSPTGPQISQVRVRVFCLPRQKKKAFLAWDLGETLVKRKPCRTEVLEVWFTTPALGPRSVIKPGTEL